jgi:hypothetical protein
MFSYALWIMLGYVRLHLFMVESWGPLNYFTSSVRYHIGGIKSITVQEYPGNVWTLQVLREVLGIFSTVPNICTQCLISYIALTSHVFGLE